MLRSYGRLHVGNRHIECTDLLLELIADLAVQLDRLRGVALQPEEQVVELHASPLNEQLRVEVRLAFEGCTLLLRRLVLGLVLVRRRVGESILNVSCRRVEPIHQAAEHSVAFALPFVGAEHELIDVNVVLLAIGLALQLGSCGCLELRRLHRLRRGAQRARSGGGERSRGRIATRCRLGCCGHHLALERR